MSGLIALVGGPPVTKGHGECFVWQNEAAGVVVAIDAGGKKAVGLQAATYGPAILVLSHDDKDHIGGAFELITTTQVPLQELWVPVDWGILVRQISMSDPNSANPTDVESIDVDDLADTIGDRVASDIEGAESGGLSTEVLVAAESVLATWAGLDLGNSASVSFTENGEEPQHWYGAKSLKEIRDRVLKRSKALIKILQAAVLRGTTIRFFSIDRALASSRNEWETQGRAGVATLANAAEVTFSILGMIPPGLPHAYALTCLSVQNRRALSTLLWEDLLSPEGGVLIWSDTDGCWLDTLSPRGLRQVVETLIASSAPHHASSNVAHDRAWDELQFSPREMPIISAGGQGNQGYRVEYKNRARLRCCTWCRPTSALFQEVLATNSATGGVLVLQQSCSSSGQHNP